MGSLRRFTLRLDVLRKRTTISLRFLKRSEILKERSIHSFGALLQSVIISVSQQHAVRVLRTHWQNLRMLCQSMFIIAMRISKFQSLLALLFENEAYNIFTTFMRKRTVISLRFKNEAFIISKCYCNQLLFLFLNSMLSGY